MIKDTIIFLTLVVLFAACSSKNVLQKENQNDPERKKKAMDHFIQGSLADQKADYNQAIKEYEKAAELDPNAGIFHALAKDYFLINKLSYALKNIDSAIKLDSNNVEYYSLLANILATGNQIDSAAAIYDKILSKDSTNIDAYFNLGLLLEKNQPMKSITVYKKLID